MIAGTGSAGVPAELIWFSKEPFFVGDEITIYAPLFNSSPYRFRGSAALEDNGQVIGKQKFALLPDGGPSVLAFPWKATAGEHVFSVVVVGGEFFSDSKNFIDLPIAQETASEVKRIVEPKPIPPAPADESPAIKYLSAVVPKAFVADTVPILGAMEQFRVNQAARARAGIGNIQSAIASGTPRSATSRAVFVEAGESGWETLAGGIMEGNIIRTPWEYVKLFFTLIYEFFASNVYAFYILLCYLAYKVIRGILNLFL